ncbi:MAG TPA: hypothetical protein VHK02_20750 [Actinomycetota bacterium]|jgi:hypothetical protein|nr:hypothetical protein [Actinomycetota bacterium]
MAESKAAWDRVGEDFKALGRQVKQHYDQRPRPERAQEPQAAEGQAQGQGQQTADRRKVDDALQKLTEALDQAFSALGDAVRDPQVGEQTKKAASSLSDALNATFAEASERFRKK